jgi:predicted MFS family arabinose efflux permease
MRAIAFVVLGLSIVPALSMKKRGVSTPSRRGLDLAAFRDSEYTLFAIAMFLGYLGLYIPFFYIQLYSLERFSITGELNFYLLPIMNATGFFGRLVSDFHFIIDLPHTMTDSWPSG